jgi:hypothetical protein
VSGPGSRRDHNRFCQIEGWTLVRDSRGKPVGHHITYELALADGQILRTRTSRPPNKETYGPRLWKAILNDQLRVSEAQFWACLSSKQAPDRGTGASRPPVSALPAGLVHQLIHAAGVSERDVASMPLDRALEIMNEYWSRPRGPAAARLHNPD